MADETSQDTQESKRIPVWSDKDFQEDVRRLGDISGLGDNASGSIRWGVKQYLIAHDEGGKGAKIDRNSAQIREVRDTLAVNQHEVVRRLDRQDTDISALGAMIRELVDGQRAFLDRVEYLLGLTHKSEDN